MRREPQLADVQFLGAGARGSHDDRSPPASHPRSKEHGRHSKPTEARSAQHGRKPPGHTHSHEGDGRSQSDQQGQRDARRTPGGVALGASEATALEMTDAAVSAAGVAAILPPPGTGPAAAAAELTTTAAAAAQVADLEAASIPALQASAPAVDVFAAVYEAPGHEGLLQHGHPAEAAAATVHAEPAGAAPTAPAGGTSTAWSAAAPAAPQPLANAHVPAWAPNPRLSAATPATAAAVTAAADPPKAGSEGSLLVPAQGQQPVVTAQQQPYSGEALPPGAAGLHEGLAHSAATGAMAGQDGVAATSVPAPTQSSIQV